MELNEDKQLKKALEEFTKAVQIFVTRDYQKALGAFESIVEKYKDSDNDNVLEVQTRANTYKNICNAQLNPVRYEGETDEEHLNEAIFNLNAGKLEPALELFQQLEEGGYQEAYVNYLRSLLHVKKEEPEVAFDYLKKAVELDDFYRVIAHNEPEFDSFFETEEHKALIET